VARSLADALVCRPQFEITDDSEAVQMLQRTSQVGEFYVMVRAALATPHALMRGCVAQLTIGACRVAGPARHPVDGGSRGAGIELPGETQALNLSA
jgi:hypothetical protein